MAAGLCIQTCEMHTGGEPLRIVTSGFPPILGDTILAKRAYCRDHLDHIRRFLMFEPRGHYDMYGAIIVDSELGDFGVIFIHNEGYSTMCGHAIIALGKWAVDSGKVDVTAAGTSVQVRINAPCGLVEATVALSAADAEGRRRAGAVTFLSVPAFPVVRGVSVPVMIPGKASEEAVLVTVDVAYGGAFYAFAPASVFGLDVRTSRARDLVDAADAVTQSVRESVTLNHPDSSELCFLYGTILTDGRTGGPGQSPSANICVFADSQVDRSPTGSGVTARMALLAASLDPGMPFAPLWDYLCALEYCDSADTDFSTLTCEFESIVGSRMRGSIHSRVTLADGAQGYRILVSGEGFYTGTSTFTLDVGDELGGGFLVR